MPWNRFKNEHDRWLPAVIACLILIGGALWAGSLLPEKAEPPAEMSKQDTAVFTVQTLREWNGCVARFEGDSDTPTEIYDVAVSSLPEEIRAQLAQGIVMHSEEELLSWIENLTS